MRSRKFLTSMSITAVLVSLMGVAGAHIHAKPAKVQVGGEAAVSFAIEHGCAGSPTTKVTIKAPASTSNVSGTAPTGWTAKTAGQVVTFQGGSLPDKNVGLFTVNFTAPTAPATLLFPTIQTCAKGSTSWIQRSGKNSDKPAPVVQVVAKK